MNSIIWKGVSSTTIKGLIISELPPISKPEMRVRETVIDGVNGSVIEELGYNPYDKPLVIGLHGNYDINEVIKYFTGEGEIVFSNEPDKVYRAKINAQIDYNRLLRYRQATVLFRTQPFKYAFNEEISRTETATASGTSIAVGDIINEHLVLFSVYGQSTQNGTPTPSSPIDIVSLCEDGSVSVTVNDKTVDLSVANGLRAIPVDDGSIATYTDASGQMWCADEIDFKNGVYIQRIFEYVCTGEEDWIVSGVQAVPNATRFDGSIITQYKGTGAFDVLCSHFVYNGTNALGTWVNKTPGAIMNLRIFVENTIFSSVDVLVAFLKEQYANGTPVTFKFIAYEPIKTPLTEEQIAICKSLKINNPSTTISNNGNAYMSLGYLKPFEVINTGLETSRPRMTIKGNGIVEISVDGVGKFSYTFPEGENQVVIDSETEDAYFDDTLKNRNMNGEFPILQPGVNKIEWTGDVESIEIEPRSRWL